MVKSTGTRPSRDEYYMRIALAVRLRANCLGSKIGAVLVLHDRVVATGYNGTPDNMDNCDEGGCERCANRETYGSGKGYDVCICVHAEQNALLSAARVGTAVEGAVLYSTLRPCFGCTKEALQAKVKAVYYLQDWSHPDEALQAQYQQIQARFPDGVKKLDLAVDEEESLGSSASSDTGHVTEGDSSPGATEDPP